MKTLACRTNKLSFLRKNRSHISQSSYLLVFKDFRLIFQTGKVLNPFTCDLISRASVTAELEIEALNYQTEIHKRGFKLHQYVRMLGKTTL